MVKLALLPGDGVGPEIMREAVKILNKVQELFGHNFEYNYALIGGAAIDKEGKALPEKTLESCEKSQAILMGAIGGPRWNFLPSEKRPERASLLPLRKKFGFYANLRPVFFFNSLRKSSPLRERILGKGNFDIMVVRELTSGIYFGKKGKGKNFASDEMRYERREVERIATLAFEIARKRKRKVVSIDKANVLESMLLWREEVEKISANYPEVEFNSLYVDNAAMQIVKNPRQFDVLLCPNLFGDILSDELAGLTGSLGLLPSAALRKDNIGLYEPVHGSAPDLAGKGIASPIAMILSVGMMLKYSLGLEKTSQKIYQAVEKTLEEGFRTSDIFTGQEKKVSTSQMGDQIIKNLENEQG